MGRDTRVGARENEGVRRHVNINYICSVSVLLLGVVMVK